MKAIALGAFGAALLASAASAAPLNATTIGFAEASNVDRVGLVCNEYYGRCWRTRGPRYVLRYYYDPSYAATADQGSSFAAGSQEAKGRSLVRPLFTDSPSDLTSRFNAVELVRKGSEALGGKGGGGRPDMAQAGGPDGAKANAALSAIEQAMAGA